MDRRIWFTLRLRLYYIVVEESFSKKTLYIGITAALILIGGIIWYWPQKRTPEPVEPAGAVGAAETLSESVPEIKTNPGEKVPEINPLDRANPFKYKNPLR
ncbi:MAG: hypothetical protein UX07_C0005G0022 [Parcubacteria group bacterium GW2011_GWA2_45_30]|nr:MAG: hypothetical protein UX07_C0005G0022 [Parcubacteria group bacterium GW2011_GWA2_45_30]